MLARWRHQLVRAAVTMRRGSQVPTESITDRASLRRRSRHLVAADSISQDRIRFREQLAVRVLMRRIPDAVRRCVPDHSISASARPMPAQLDQILAQLVGPVDTKFCAGNYRIHSRLPSIFAQEWRSLVSFARGHFSC